MPDGVPIHCDEHGPSLPMYVCIHIDARSVEPSDVKVEDDCAWCSACDEKGASNLTAEEIRLWCADHFREWMDA